MSITIDSLRCIAGPNVWSRTPVALIRLDVGSPATFEPGHARGLAERLTGFLRDELADPVFEIEPREPISFDDDHAPAELVGTLALNLQRLASYVVTFRVARPATGAAQELVVEYGDELVGAAAAKLAVRVINRLVAGDAPPGAFQSEVARFGTLASSRRLYVDAGPTVAAARRRGIPVARFDPSGRIIELGNGAYRRRILGSVTSRTSVVGDSIVGNKHLTNHYLRSAGLPVPDGAMARTLEQALAVAAEIGYPVVVKPVDAGYSLGVSLDVRDDNELGEAFEPAVTASSSRRVLVERYIAGNEYRVTVVDGSIVSASLRIHEHVVGDGRLAVRELIDLTNADPRRGRRESDPIRQITVDAKTLKMLARQDLDLDSIPAPGRRVLLKPSARTPGGITVDQTDVVHPDNVAIILQAVRVLDLDAATVDIVAHDITKPSSTADLVILELNTRSGFRADLYPAVGTPRDPGPAFVEMLFPPGQPVRVPIFAVTGDLRAADLVSRLIARVLTETGVAVGLVSTSGLVVDGRKVRAIETLDPAGVATLLNNPATEAVVAQLDAEQIVKNGLGFDYCDVGVVLSLSGIGTPFAKPVETVVAEALTTDGVLVLNAKDSATVQLAEGRDRLPVLFALDSENDLVWNHRQRGGKSVVVRSGPYGAAISLIDAGTVTDVLPATTPAIAADLPEEWSSLVLTAAAAAAIARDVPLEAIRRALS